MITKLDTIYQELRSTYPDGPARGGRKAIGSTQLALNATRVLNLTSNDQIRKTRELLGTSEACLQLKGWGDFPDSNSAG